MSPVTRLAWLKGRILSSLRGNFKLEMNLFTWSFTHEIYEPALRLRNIARVLLCCNCQNSHIFTATSIRVILDLEIQEKSGTKSILVLFYQKRMRIWKIFMAFIWEMFQISYKPRAGQPCSGWRKKRNILTKERGVRRDLGGVIRRVLQPINL